ncbi:trypsin-like peptidase domain-containing protein [Patescibacteria group bacterium]|nr:trypsin-like peptidase domain-containing protein [Patescibacteria group bacterium]MCL5798459.1 trypsin-like peptidase domain-containing protein [Patescibacteria group bacterium]
MKKIIIASILVLLGILVGLGINTSNLSSQFQNQSSLLPHSTKQTVVYEQSVITKVVKDSLPSVVTVGISTTQTNPGSIEFNPFNPFSPFQQLPGETQKIQQNIGSGFIVTSDGMIITNKHVVSDTNAAYQIVTNDNKKYDVAKIYRDPLNDLAILKINASGLKPLPLGDSSNLELGQLVVAIGTPLGEFNNTVTSGIISGLGRGITAGSPLEGSVEKLNNVIQTDAAINPGNSGGPLLNSNGQAIGINTAIAQSGQNIGFAIPINSVKTLLSNFQKTGDNFQQPFLGVRYKMIDQQLALMNDVPQGAYVISIVTGSPADKGGIQQGDIITEFAGSSIQGNNQELSQIVLKQRVGEKIKVAVWRNGKTLSLNVTIGSAN